MLTVSRDELDDNSPPNSSVSLVTRNAVLFEVFYTQYTNQLLEYTFHANFSRR